MRILLAVAALAAQALPIHVMAQRTARDSSDAYFEMYLAVGAFAPLGQQRDTLANSVYYELATVAAPVREVALVASVGWAPTHHRKSASNSAVDVTNLYAGVEARPYSISRGAIAMTPFVAIGMGTRSYERASDMATDSALAGYASIGIACHYAATGVRLSLSDHISTYASVGRDQASARHEVIVSVGLIGRAVP